MGEYALAADLARLVVTRAHRGAVATAVAIALRRPGGTTRDLYLLERAASSRLATSRGEVFFATRDGELVQFDDENWEFTRNWSKLGNSRVLCVSMGVDFGIAVTDQGSVFTWGSNEHGQLGQELVPGGFRREPTRSCETLSDVASVAAGVDYAWCVTRKGEAYSWGACADFPLPSNHEVFVRHGTRHVTTPVRADTHGSTAVSACAGYDANILLCDDGTCLVSGDNSDGELGLGDRVHHGDRFHRLELAGERIIKTSTTMMNDIELHTLLLTSSGKMFGCGSNLQSQLVRKANSVYASPVRLTNGESFRDICCGDGISFAASRDGDGIWKLHCYGSGRFRNDVIYDTMDVDGPITKLADARKSRGDNLLVVTSPRNSAERVYEWIHNPSAEAVRLDLVLDMAVDILD